MNKVKIENIHIDQVDTLIEEAINQLNKDPRVQKKIESLTITNNELHVHLATMLRYQEDQKDVAACVAANQCVKKTNHYLMDIERDEGGHLLRVIKPCPLIEKSLSAQQFLIHFDYDQEFMQPQLFENLKERKAISELFLYLLKVSNKSTTQNLYVYGPHNSGKTYALAVFAYKYALNEFGTIALIKTHHWLEKLLAMKTQDAYFFQKELDKLSQLDVLILDELGAKDLDEVSRDSILIPLLTERLKLKKKTMISSVFAPSELLDLFKKYPSWLPRVKELIALIEAQAKIIELPATYDL
jgi:DNA replication protein DnaC